MLTTHLSVATDFYDEVVSNQCFYDKEQLTALMAYCRSLGAESLDWIVDDMWALYDSYPGGFDLLQVAVDAAHAEGMTFHAVYKPFEGTLSHLTLPHTAPRFAGMPVRETLNGLVPIVRPFIAAHPECCLKRWPGDEDPGGAIQTIRLVKGDDAPVTLRAEDITIWTSSTNGRFQPYQGRFTLETHCDWRPIFPLGRTCWIVSLTGLEIPAGERYIEVRFSENAFAGQPFRNAYTDLIELERQDGTVIPATTAAVPPPCEHYPRLLAKPYMMQLVRYAHHPLVQAWLADAEQMTADAGEMRDYTRTPGEAGREYALDQCRFVSVARGKADSLPGILNPAYPEVREEWLRTVRFCIERGVDAVDFRVGYHLPPQQQCAYGFNEPVLQALGGAVDLAGAARVMGEAYTHFLRQARELLHAHGKEIGVHLLTNFLLPRDEGLATPSRELIDFQWETWVAEIADFAVLRGAMGLREESLRYCIDRFAGACRQAGVPLTYQCNRRFFASLDDVLNLPCDRLTGLRYEMDLALAHPGVTGYQLYETANFSRLDEQGRFCGNAQLAPGLRLAGAVSLPPAPAG
ncbi:MAG: hypothetical protein ACYDCO_06415 [Armatimonadota bacterium]